MLAWNVFLIVTPLLIAGIVRIFSDKYKVFNTPIDFGTGIFGENKTWQGFLFLSSISFLVGFGFYYFSLTSELPFYYGLVLGVFYNLGELLNSAVKRKLKIKSGQNNQIGSVQIIIQYLIDQIDSTLATLPVVMVWIGFWPGIISFLIGSLVHFLVDIINHLYGSKKSSDKYGIINFYQFLGYLLLFPLKFYIKNNHQKIDFTRKNIITSNHAFFLDSLFLLESLSFRSFLKFIPFRFLVSPVYKKPFLKELILILGGVFKIKDKTIQPRPLQILIQDLKDDYNILICYEGDISRSKKDEDKLPTGIWVMLKEVKDSTVKPFYISDQSKKLTIKKVKDFEYKEKYHSSRIFLKELNQAIYSASKKDHT
jgi:hypothetical protein